MHYIYFRPRIKPYYCVDNMWNLLNIFDTKKEAVEHLKAQLNFDKNRNPGKWIYRIV